MKKVKHPTERGQALILIVFAMVALIGITGLAVDGGNAYAERRRAQNAADTTAIDAALGKIRNGNLYNEGLARAASNGYTDGDPGVASTNADINVEIYNPPTNGAYAGQSEYVQVVITATIPTYFGRIVGISEITNKVQAVARAKPAVILPIAFGNAIVSLNPSDCKALTYQGHANTILTGGGLYVNSSCADKAFFNNSNAGSLTAPCLQAVGGIEYTTGSVNVPSNCIISGASTLPEMVYPNPTCSGAATVNGSNMSPGNYSGQFPPNGVTHLEPGIYCVDGNFRLNGGDTLTGSDVVIVMETGDVTINGGATVQLDAPDSGPYEDLLIYMPEDNHGTVTINGDSTSSFSGTILAPGSDIKIDGTGGATGFNSQVIGWNVDISGTSAMNIFYSDQDNIDLPIPPQVELVQ